MFTSFKRRKDPRPICDCSSYPFPHKLGEGKCDGSDFAEEQYYHNPVGCTYCNLNTKVGCEVIEGIEDIKHGECYQEAMRLRN